MFDMHIHLVPSVDDGIPNMDKAIETIKVAKKNGIDEIFLTSHYMEDGYKVSPKLYKKRIENLKNEIESNNLEMKLYIGNEVMIFPSLVDELKKGSFFTLNDSRYVLIELPLNQEVLYLKDVLFELRVNGYIPIIAHPERYSYIQKNLSFLDDLLEQEVLFQMNAGSIIGLYGNGAKKIAKYMLNHKLVHFLGSDSHSPNFVYEKYLKVLKKIEKFVGKDYLDCLVNENPDKVKNNEEILI